MCVTGKGSVDVSLEKYSQIRAGEPIRLKPQIDRRSMQVCGAADEYLRFSLSNSNISKLGFFGTCIQLDAAGGILDGPIAMDVILERKLPVEQWPRDRTRKRAVERSPSVSVRVDKGQILEI